MERDKSNKPAGFRTYTLLGISAVLVVLCGEYLTEKRFNGGYCQVCKEKVIPIGSRYGTNYYCPNCCRWNE